MKTRLLLNLVLVCVVGALVLVAIFEPGKEKPKINPLTSIEENKIDRVTLQGQETMVFERQNGHWWLKSPISAPANEIRMRQLIDVARAESDAQYPLKPEDLPKFELDKPKATLTLGETTIRFGGSDPIDMRRYVQVGDTLHLVRDDFYHHLTAKSTEYVDKKLLPDDAKITSIVIPGVKASLGQDGKWTLEPAAADVQTTAGNLSSAWQSARAIDVKVWEKPAPGETVRIGYADGGGTEFVIIRREPELVLGRSDWGLQYEVVGELAKQLLNQKVAEEEAKAADDRSPEPDEAETTEGTDESPDSDADDGDGEEPDHKDAKEAPIEEMEE